MSLKLHFNNEAHYGDCLFSLHFLVKLCQCNDINCEFYCLPENRKQLQEFIPQNAKIIISDQRFENGIDLWVGSGLKEKAFIKFRGGCFKCERYKTYEDYFKIQLAISQIVCEENNLNNPYQVREDTIFDEETLKENPINQNFDYLIVNSYCRSLQVAYSEKQQDFLFLELIKKIKEKNKTFITTHKLLDFFCTADYGLSLVQIGQLSKKCKILIGVPTAPFLISLNKFAIKNFERIINITHLDHGFDLDDRFLNVNSQNIPLLSSEWDIPKVTEKSGIWQEGALDLNHAKLASKQPNLNKLGDAGGFKDKALPT